MTRNFCTNCGNRLSNAPKFCDSCGYPVGGDKETGDPSTIMGSQYIERPHQQACASAPSKPRPKRTSGSPLPSASARAQPSGESGAGKLAQIRFQRVWEPNENAFSVLIPEGWKVYGGIFNVDPLQTNGPGNTISPKCDFAVKSDDRGTVMIHWIPTWNYADLSLSPTGFSLFWPGQQYQGMLVKIIISARQFLIEMLQRERPQACAVSVISEDRLPEVADAFAAKAQEVNMFLMQQGQRPLTFESLAMTVEYYEAEQRFRETTVTTIADNRGGAFMWSNENTSMMRAPAAEFDSWRAVLNQIQTSPEPNPQWIAALLKYRGQRAKGSWETQQYIHKVAGEILAHRRQTYADIRETQGKAWDTPTGGSGDRGDQGDQGDEGEDI